MGTFLKEAMKGTHVLGGGFVRRGGIVGSFWTGEGGGHEGGQQDNLKEEEVKSSNVCLTTAHEKTDRLFD